MFDCIDYGKAINLVPCIQYVTGHPQRQHARDQLAPGDRPCAVESTLRSTATGLLLLSDCSGDSRHAPQSLAGQTDPFLGFLSCQSLCVGDMNSLPLSQAQASGVHRQQSSLGRPVRPSASLGLSCGRIDTMKRSHQAVNAATAEMETAQPSLHLKTYNAETLSAQELKQFIARPRIDFTSILQKVAAAEGAQLHGFHRF